MDAPDDCAPPAGFDDVIITQDCNEECEASRMEVRDVAAQESETLGVRLRKGTTERSGMGCVS